MEVTEFRDANWPSFVLLRKKLKTYFGGDKHCLLGVGHTPRWPKQEIVDVVLFGDGALALLVYSGWPKDRTLRLWSLSTTNASLMSRITGIPLRHFGVIPRYALWPKAKERTFPRDEENWTLVLAHRSASTKQTELCVEVAARIQELSKGTVGINICGPGLAADEIATMRAMIRQCRWKSPPQILGNLGADWTTHKSMLNQPVLMTLSTNFAEDFGVNVAQAQARGWPVIVSDWGAHRDVCGSNVIKIPSTQVFSQRTEQIVKHFLENRSARVEPSRRTNTRPAKISFQELTSRLGHPLYTPAELSTLLFRRRAAEDIPAPLLNIMTKGRLTT